MANLCIKLPPFSPDYSGVASALYDLNCLSILHDASGCTGNYTSYDEPRWYGGKSPVMCSGLREIDAVLGDDEKLINNTLKAAKELNVSLIAIIGSPVPMVIGADTIGISREIEYLSQIPTFGFETTGTKYYDFGMNLALLKLAKKFMVIKPKTKAPSINIVGANILDFSCVEELQSIKKITKQINVETISTFPLKATLNSIKNAPSAWLNVVVTKSGLGVAKYMEKEFGQPYIVYIPVGEKGTEIFINKICEKLYKKEPPKDQQVFESELIDTLIIGEQVRANSLRDCFGVSRCQVNTLFGIEDEIMLPGDKDLESEWDILEAVNDKKYKRIIADPLILDLINNEDIQKISIPHFAVSSKLYKENKKDLIGKSLDFISNKNI